MLLMLAACRNISPLLANNRPTYQSMIVYFYCLFCPMLMFMTVNEGEQKHWQDDEPLDFERAFDENVNI